MTRSPINVLALAVPMPQPIVEQRHVFDRETGLLRAHTPVERYVRTIPFAWMKVANRLPGKAAAVGIGLWFLAGVRKSKSFRLSAEAVDLAGCSRGALYNGLDALERAHLIRVQRRSGARPVITLLHDPSPVGPDKSAGTFSEPPMNTATGSTPHNDRHSAALDRIEARARHLRQKPHVVTPVQMPITTAAQLRAAKLDASEMEEAFACLSEDEKSLYVGDGDEQPEVDDEMIQ